jgi:DNA-binding NarL/FixJ family response regulator
VLVIDAIKSVQAAIVELKAMKLRYENDSKYLVVGTVVESDDLIVLLRAGMDGYLRLQDMTPEAFRRTVSALLDGECAIPRSMVGTLASFIRWPQTRSATNGYAREDQGAESELTARERDVLRLLTMGARNREIAQILVISLATVNKHVQHIFNKLEVHSRTAAMRKVMAQPVDMEVSTSIVSQISWQPASAKENGLEQVPSIASKRQSRAR